MGGHTTKNYYETADPHAQDALVRMAADATMLGPAGYRMCQVTPPAGTPSSGYDNYARCISDLAPNKSGTMQRFCVNGHDGHCGMNYHATPDAPPTTPPNDDACKALGASDDAKNYIHCPVGSHPVGYKPKAIQNAQCQLYCAPNK